MIQGAGSKVWVSTVFKEISAGLQNSTELLPKSQPEKELCQTSEKTPHRKSTFVPETPYGFGPFLPKPSKSNSPMNFISRLFGGSNGGSSPSNYDQADLQKSPIFNKKGKKRYHVPENYKNIVPKTLNETDIIVDEETSCKQVDEEAFCKQPFQDEDEPIISEKSISSNNVGDLSNLDTVSLNSQTDIVSAKEMNHEQNTEECKEKNTNTENCALQQTSIDLENSKAAVSLLQQENRELQEKLKQIIDYSKEVKSENEKLLSLSESNKEEINNLKLKLCDAVKTAKLHESDVKTLKTKLSEETACSLLLEEENKKLKLENKSVTKEKQTYLDQMIRKTGLSDTIEAKIESEVKDLKDQMQEFKDSVFSAITGLKSQVEKSRTVTGLNTQTNQPSTNQVPQSSEIQETITTNATATDTQQQPAANRRYSALIVGDSTTRILSSNKLSEDDLQVKIKSHPGGRLHDLYNSVIRMAETDEEFICTTDAVIIHGGTNNLSDGHSIESVEQEVAQIVHKIKHVNPECKIIVSSVMPRKNNPLANQLIKQTNQSLKRLCDTNSYSFMDITENVIKDNVPDTDLYRDNIHLNAKGGKIFGELISATIREKLNLGVDPIQPSAARQQDFQIGRPPGRSSTNSNKNNTPNRNNKTRDQRNTQQKSNTKYRYNSQYNSNYNNPQYNNNNNPQNNYNNPQNNNNNPQNSNNPQNNYNNPQNNYNNNPQNSNNPQNNYNNHQNNINNLPQNNNNNSPQNNYNNPHNNYNNPHSNNTQNISSNWMGHQMPMMFMPMPFPPPWTPQTGIQAGSTIQ